MLATLRICQKRANLREVRLGPVTIVGRSADCQLRIASAEVSRRHCQLLLRADGLYLEDLGSANGTFLDGIRVPQNSPTYARPGARLDVGPARFLVDYATDATTQLTGPDTQAMLPSAVAAEPRATEEPMSAGSSTDDSLPAVTDPFRFTEPVAPPVPSAVPVTARRPFFDFFRRRTHEAVVSSGENCPSEEPSPAPDETLLTDIAHLSAATSEPAELFPALAPPEVEIAVDAEPVDESLQHFLKQL
jgi:pSer/pThr/pTyr-binding forkhead associated (FHA) protein